MPAKGNDLKATVRLEGGAAFKKEISDVNSSMKQLDAESKKVTASFDGFVEFRQFIRDAGLKGIYILL